MRKTVLVLAILAASGAVFNLIAIPLCHEEVFVHRDHFSLIEIFMGLAFLIILAFNILSIIQLILQIQQEKGGHTGHVLLLIFAIICMIGLMGQKVMLDEVAHEYALGWSIQGEWVLFLALLSLQLIYSVLTLIHLFRQKFMS
jgi:hypothetical protein